MKKYILGVDVGGTNIKLGVIDKTGSIISRSRLDTKSYIRSKNKLIEAVITEINDMFSSCNLKKSHFVGVGIGLPGLVDPINGIVKFLPNIPGWKNVPLKKIFEKQLSLPAYIENDVNLITLGEWKYGAGKGVSDMICLTLGTGVGSGLILDGKLYRGAGYAAGELGHIPLNEKGPQCGCKGYGCLESYVGNKRLQERAAKIFKRKQIVLEEVTDLAEQGNLRAKEFWQETASHIGNALTGVVNLLNPARIVIGGGVSDSHKFLFKTIEKTIKNRAMKAQASMFKIVKARLGNDGGIIGARVLIEDMKNLKRKKRE